MRTVFSYAPIARSMGPMLSEEGFHIGSGRGFLRDLAVAAHNDAGRYSIEEIQKVLNVWVPRGVEMFGNERGGDTAIAFGFKDRNNGTAQGEYYSEVREVLELVNIAVVQTKVKGTPAPEARTIVREVQDTRDTVSGLEPMDLLFAPDVKFFRSRGMEEIAFMPYDVNGEMITENGKPVSGEKYLAYLTTVLPGYYMAGREFAKYRHALLGRETPQAGRRYGR